MSSSNPNNLAQALPGAGGSFAVNGLYEIQAASIDSTCFAAGAVNAAALGAGAVQSSNVNPNLIQTISVTLTNTQATAMYTLGQQIIPAPGLGKSIVVLSALLRYVYGVHAYTSGGAVQLQYDSTLNAGGTTPLTTVAASVLLATASSDTQMQQAATTTTVPQNKGIFAACATNNFAIAAGNTSSITFIVQYVVV